MTSLRIAALAFAALSAAMASGTVSAMPAMGSHRQPSRLPGTCKTFGGCAVLTAVGGHPAPIGVARTGAPAPIGITGVGITTGGEFLAEGRPRPATPVGGRVRVHDPTGRAPDRASRHCTSAAPMSRAFRAPRRRRANPLPPACLLQGSRY